MHSIVIGESIMWRLAIMPDVILLLEMETSPLDTGPTFDLILQIISSISETGYMVLMVILV